MVAATGRGRAVAVARALRLRTSLVGRNFDGILYTPALISGAEARKQMFPPGFIVMVAGARGGVLPTTLNNISMMQQRINKEIVTVGVVGLWVILKEGTAGKRWKKRKKK